MKMPQKNKIVLFLFVSLVAVASFIYIGFNSRQMDGYALVLSLLGASAALIGFALSSENYLKGENKEDKIKPQEDAEKQKKDNSKCESIDAVGFLKDSLEDPTSSPQREVLRRAYDYEDFVSLRRRDVITHFRKTETRLMDEIDGLKRRANTNMILGAIIAFVGVLGLVTFILGEPEQPENDITLIIVHWVTRLSLVSFVEIFAFFFLKMYKTELLSIQYYQDELTSIESRKIALLFAIIHDNAEDISKSIDCLVNIDRNFKLDVNQTTVDLEKLKTENSFIKSQMDSMMDIFKGAISFKIKGNNTTNGEIC